MKNLPRAFRPLVVLSGQSIIYGAGIFARQVAVYLAIPLFTDNMSRQQYGVVVVTSSILSFLNILTNVGIPIATYRLYNERKDEDYKRLILGAGQQLSAGFAFLAGLVIFLFASIVSTLMFGNPEYDKLIRIAAVLLFIESLVNYGTVLLRVQVRPMVTNLQSMVHITAQLGFALLFVIGLNLGALGYFYGFTAGAVIGLFYMIWLVKNVIDYRISIPHITEMMKYGLPVLPAALALWVINLADRAIISQLIGLDATAIYDVGYRIGLIAGFPIAPIKAAWLQFSFSLMYSPRAKEVYRNSLTFFIFLFVSSALFIITFQKLLVSVLSPDTYGEAVKVVLWVALSQVALGACLVLSLGLHIAKKTNYAAGVAIASAAVNILMNLVLIPVMGIVGAAIATLGAYIVLAVASYFVGQRFYTIPIDGLRLGKVAFAGALSAFTLWHVDQSHWTPTVNVLLHAFGLLLFPILLAITKFASREELKALWDTGMEMLHKKGVDWKNEFHNVEDFEI